MFHLWQLRQMLIISFESVLSKRFISMLALHSNIMNNPFGSKLINSHTSYKTLVTNNNPHFQQRIQLITNKNYQHVQELGIFERTNQPTPNIFYFRASKYRSGLREDIQEFIVKQIDHFLHNFNSSYAIAYQHSSIFDFLAFRKFIEKWPEHFFHRLRKVYIQGPSMMVRFFQTFSVGTFYRLCDQIFQNVDNLDTIKLADTQILNSLGQTITKTESYKNSVKVIENQLYGRDIDQYDLQFGRYPHILLQLMGRLIKDPQQLKTQGIFRKSCDHDQLQRLEGQIIANQTNAIQNQEDVFVVAGCLKKILHNLHTPLFNYGIYEKVINYQSGDEMTFIQKLLGDMEYVNHKVFILMTVFLNDYVVSQKEHNKMGSYNLAVIFGPCFFRPKEYDLKDLIYSGKFAKILLTIFDSPSELIEASQIDLARGTLKQLNE